MQIRKIQHDLLLHFEAAQAQMLILRNSQQEGKLGNWMTLSQKNTTLPFKMSAVKRCSVSTSLQGQNDEA